MIRALLDELAPFYEVFHKSGHLLYLVGGAVRDLALGKPPKDLDFTTDATPAEVMKLFKRVIPTGIDHGTVMVLFRGRSYEVTTFRIEGQYDDSRHPASVRFTPSLEEDLKRRDLTINALALDPGDGRILDFHGGLDDLKNGLIRAIGDPAERFREDALRMLRACRFASQLGFEVDPVTLGAIAPLSPLVLKLSRERIREELEKTLSSPNPGRGLGLLRTTGLLGLIFPFLERSGESQPQGQAAYSFLAEAPREPTEIRWALLFHFWLSPRGRAPSASETDQACGEMKKLTMPNKAVHAVRHFLTVLSAADGMTESETRPHEILFQQGSRDIDPLSAHWTAAVQAGLWMPRFDLPLLLEQVRELADTGRPVFLKDLAVNGADLSQAGIPAGPQIGKVLHRLLESVWKAPEINRKDLLLDLAKSF